MFAAHAQKYSWAPRRNCVWAGNGGRKLRERVGETVAASARAAHAVRIELGAQRFVVGNTSPNLGGGGVALAAVQVVVLFSKVDLAVRPCVGHLAIPAEIV